jgi:hypothetical protein
LPLSTLFHILVPYINKLFLFDTYGDFGKKGPFFYRSQWGKSKFWNKSAAFATISPVPHIVFHPSFPPFFLPHFLLIGGRGYMMMGHVKYCVVFFSARGVFILQVSNRNNSLTDCTQVNNRIIMQVQLEKGGKMCMQLLMFLFLSKNS